MEFTPRSQAGQDEFIHIMFTKYLGLKDYKGTFLDMGACDPIINNNTYELERLGWRGILFDLDEKYTEEYTKIRKSQYYIGDITKIEWVSFLKERGYEEVTVIDYLSLDIDDATLSVVRNFPWDKYTFRFITAEHDMYKDNIQKKVEMYETFNKLGYICLHENVANENNYFEDWWVHPKVVDMEKLPPLQSTNCNWQKIVTSNSVYKL